MPSPLNIAIIGAGLAGPTLALCLKKQHGLSCTIYELRPGPDERGTNIALTPNALRVLQHIGVYDKLRLLGYNYEELALNNGSGQQLAKFLNGSEELYNFDSLRVHRKTVQKVLLDEVYKQGITVHYNMKLVNLDEDSESGVELRFEDGSTTTADFVIGTDGIHSRVRPAVSHVSPLYSGFFGVTGTVQNDQLDNSRGHHLPGMFFGQSGFMAVMPCSHDGKQVSFFSTMEFPERSRKGWEDLFNRSEEIHEILNGRFTGTWPALVRSICNKVDQRTLASWPFYIVPSLEKWVSSSGRIVLIGDAAHAITPQGGQGAAMAFEDAETLAYITVRVDFMEQRSKLLKIWENHRRDRLVRVKEFTGRNNSLRDPGRSYLRQIVKEYAVLGAFKYLGPSAGVEWLYGYDAENIIGILRRT